jgi:cytochrome c-type biogenesis protein CcmH
VVVAALLLAAPAWASERRPTLAELETELICPTCHTTLDQSSSAIADRMREFIRGRIAAGDTKSEIKAKLVAQFGPAVLASPPRKGLDWLVWVIPPVGLVAGAGAAGALAWRWSRRRRDEEEETAEELDPELERRVDAELRRFDE